MGSSNSEAKKARRAQQEANRIQQEMLLAQENMAALNQQSLATNQPAEVLAGGTAGMEDLRRRRRTNSGLSTAVGITV